LLGHQAFELGVLRLQQFEPLEFRGGQALVSAAPVVEGLLRDAVLTAEIMVNIYLIISFKLKKIGTTPLNRDEIVMA
jgi:hypothetical protein